jgi:RimJ/RimL family protein N-acetyltransferase
MKLVGSVLYGADREVAAMVASRIPHVRDKGFGECAALGVVRDGQLVGGVVFTMFSGHDIHVHMAFDSPRWATPQTLRELYSYPFRQLPCVRMTAPISRKNKRMRRLAEGLGFELEGVMRKGLDGKDDLMIYGTLRDKCRWVKGN